MSDYFVIFVGSGTGNAAMVMDALLHFFTKVIANIFCWGLLVALVLFVITFMKEVVFSRRNPSDTSGYNDPEDGGFLL